uniref:Uncharacterized protein LOC111120689 n=1 Tax=Crassostrea virginica TaxID=6565 RepID=A0A8B8CN88_CRAVI|nr:uncharacterized protein LOC111120689 [Crassostrea virginica]XP_022317314.1 uncharacterized protein LOC111120689 [Crassostrea virginica]XP_022317315.1 uncharacterized protein LOC111120689 [Crassostrea virginica]
MPRSKESLNFLLVLSLLHVASKVLIRTVQSVTSRLNTTLEQLLILHRHGLFHSWKTKECCQCNQSFKNSTSILSSAEWNLLFQKTKEDCERASNVECSCCFQANGGLDPESFSINMATCILEKAEALEENEIKNIRIIRDIKDRLVQNREEATLAEDKFTSLSDDLNKALHHMSKQHGDEYYNDIVETIQKIDSQEPDDDEARRTLKRFDQDNQVRLDTNENKMRPLKLELHRVDSMRSDISVCGSDEETPSESGQKMDADDVLLLADNQITQDTDSVDLGDSDFDDEEEEREYGKVLERMKEKFGYLHRKCVAVGKDLTDVRQRLERSWSVPESRAQPEEALRQELKEIGMMRKFIDTKLDDDDVRHVYLPYEDFQIIDNQGVNFESPYLRHMSTTTRYNGNTIQRPPRPTFQSYTQLHSSKKQLSQSLSSISNIFKRNLHAASSWRLDQIPRKYDQGNMVTSLAKSEGNLLGTSSSRPGNELGKGKEFEEVRPFIREHTSSGFRIDYSKYEKCIKESEKVLEDPLSAGIDKESILCEKQHGHYLSMCEQQSQGLVKKCENLKQKIQQLKSRFDNCEHLLSDNAGLCENMGKRYERHSSEVMRISSVPSVKPEPSVKLVNTEPPYQRYTSSSSIVALRGKTWISIWILLPCSRMTKNPFWKEDLATL